MRELLIAVGPGEWRAALLEDGIAVELLVERGDRAESGSVHLGRVCRLVPALAAALVDIGGARPAFLPQGEIVPRGARLDEGERVIVQIRREAQGGKAARVTMRVTLRGRHAELVVDRPEPTGDEAAGLIERWRDIRDRASRCEPPARLDPGATFAAALASALPAAPSRIVADEPAAIPEIRAAFPGAVVAHEPEADWPIDLDAVIDQALSTTIALAGGGAVHIEAARAAVLIDVDSGTPQTGSPERTGLAANLAAAALIAREIRRRNLGGGIVVDFVGLDSRASRERVRETLAKALTPDPAKPQILGWTRLGHLELVRPRRGRPLAEALVDPAAGSAAVKTAVTVAHEALRALRRQARAEPGGNWRLCVAPDVAAALAGAAAAALHALEGRLARPIAVEAESGRARERVEISRM